MCTATGFGGRRHETSILGVKSISADAIRNGNLNFIVQGTPCVITKMTEAAIFRKNSIALPKKSLQFVHSYLQIPANWLFLARCGKLQWQWPTPCPWRETRNSDASARKTYGQFSKAFCQSNSLHSCLSSHADAVCSPGDTTFSADLR